MVRLTKWGDVFHLPPEPRIPQEDAPPSTTDPEERESELQHSVHSAKVGCLETDEGEDLWREIVDEVSGGEEGFEVGFEFDELGGEGEDFWGRVGEWI